MTCRIWYRSVARANATECATVGFYASAPALEFSDNDKARTVKHLTLAGIVVCIAAQEHVQAYHADVPLQPIFQGFIIPEWSQ